MIIEHPKSEEAQFREIWRREQGLLDRIKALFADWPADEREELIAKVIAAYLVTLFPNERSSTILSIVRQTWRWLAIGAPR